MTDKHKKALQKANDYIEKYGSKVQETDSRLKIHFMPPVGWMNDPNGVVYHNNEYHLFFQFYPYDVDWGPMHWGHAKSTDGIRWEYLPVALAPSEEYDFSETERGHGCFSGSAISLGNELVLMYTGNVDGRKPKQTQNIAISSDGINFDKFQENPVITGFPSEATEDFRDPKIWKHADTYYSIIGTKKEGKGKAAIYSSLDLKKWDYQGITTESNDKQGDMWECPDLFNIDGQDILVVSPMYGSKNSNPYYLVGDFNYQNCEFNQHSYEILDYGNDFYAPQTLLDGKGRRIMIAWMDIWFAKMPERADGWAGAMTIARELNFKNGKLYQFPISELEKYRVQEKIDENIELQKNKYEAKLYDASDIELIIDISKTTTEEFDIFLKCSQEMSEYTKVSVDLKNMQLTVNRELSGEGEKTSSTTPISLDGKQLKLRILIDTNSIELFVNDGEYTITNRVYPKNSDNCFVIQSDSKLFFDKIATWALETTK